MGCCWHDRAILPRFTNHMILSYQHLPTILPTFTNIYQHLPTFTNIYQHLPTFTIVGRVLANGGDYITKGSEANTTGSWDPWKAHGSPWEFDPFPTIKSPKLRENWICEMCGSIFFDLFLGVLIRGRNSWGWLESTDHVLTPVIEILAVTSQAIHFPSAASFKLQWNIKTTVELSIIHLVTVQKSWFFPLKLLQGIYPLVN